MVWIRFGRGPRRGYGGYGGYGGYPRGYGGGGGGGCLRDLFLLDAGCCLAEALGCGGQLFLIAPQAGRLVGRGLVTHRHGGDDSLAVRLVRLYQERISSHRARPCCRMTPSCSAYAVEALTTHGTGRGLRLTARRLLRCRPGGRTGLDPVPAR